MTNINVGQCVHRQSDLPGWLRVGASFNADLKNAGAHWVDQEAVVDTGLVTSRSPDDIPVFSQETIKLFSSAIMPGAVRGTASKAAFRQLQREVSIIRSFRLFCITAAATMEFRAQKTSH
jgi:hypothetical protein